MSNEAQKPIVAVGTKFAVGTVTAIHSNKVSIDTAEGVKEFSFSQVEGFVNDERFVSEA